MSPAGEERPFLPGTPLETTMLDYVTTHDDPDATLTRWVIDGASRTNTDHGRLYVRITQDADTTVSLYRDAARSVPVAEGTLVGDDTGEVTLTEENDSGLSGSVELQFASAMDAALDVFYADDADLIALQKCVADFLVSGQFGGRPGFADPLARAKRVMDAMLNARLPRGWRADSLQPLADATARFALFFIYDHLSSRDDDASAQRARYWRVQARAALPAIQLSIDGCLVRPFTPRVERA
jgi:hypothetical protein